MQENSDVARIFPWGGGGALRYRRGGTNILSWQATPPKNKKKVHPKKQVLIFRQNKLTIKHKKKVITFVRR